MNNKEPWMPKCIGLIAFLGPFFIFAVGVAFDTSTKARAAERAAKEQIVKREVRAQTFNKVTGLFLTGEEWDAFDERERIAIIQRTKNL